MPGASFKLRRSRRLKGRRPNRRRIGESVEALALRHLTQKGYTLVERNYRTRHGEIHLVVYDERSLILVQMYKAANLLNWRSESC